MQQSAEYEIRDYLSEDESPVLDLVQQGMGSGPAGIRDKSFWRWKHFNNPFGHSIALVATNREGQIIGLRTFMRWRFSSGDTLVKAVRAVDTVTHPDYRGHGVFSTLTRKAVEQSKNSEIALIFGTPNTQVLPIYLKLGWDLVPVIRPLVKILNYPRFVTSIPRILQNLTKSRTSGYLSPERILRQELPSVSEFLRLSGVVEQLLFSHSQTRNEYLSTDYSIDYLQWRYSEYPSAKYLVYYREKRGALLGCVILRPSTRFNLKEVVLDDMFFSEPDEGLVSSLLDEAERYLNADYIIAYFPESSFEHHILRRNGFHQIPIKGMDFIVNVLASNMPCDPKVMESWNINLGDLEVF